METIIEKNKLETSIHVIEQHITTSDDMIDVIHLLLSGQECKMFTFTVVSETAKEFWKARLIINSAELLAYRELEFFFEDLCFLSTDFLKNMEKQMEGGEFARRQHVEKYDAYAKFGYFKEVAEDTRAPAFDQVVSMGYIMGGVLKFNIPLRCIEYKLLWNHTPGGNMETNEIVDKFVDEIIRATPIPFATRPFERLPFM